MLTKRNMWSLRNGKKQMLMKPKTTTRKHA